MCSTEKIIARTDWMKQTIRLISSLSRSRYLKRFSRGAALNRYFHAALTKNFTYHMPYYRFGGGASYFSQREKLYAIVIEAAINQNMRYSCFTMNNSIGCSSISLSRIDLLKSFDSLIISYLNSSVYTRNSRADLLPSHLS